MFACKIGFRVTRYTWERLLSVIGEREATSAKITTLDVAFSFTIM